MTGWPPGVALSHRSPAMRIRRWAAIGLAAQVIFTLGWLLADRWQGAGYSPIRYTISDETALGAPHAWFLITCQLLAGAGTIGFALFGLRPALAPAGPVARYAPWMLAAGALVYLVIWPRLPCRLADAGCSVHQHLASPGGLTDAIGSGLLIGVLVMTPFPLWRRLRELPEWQRARPVMIAARLLGPVLVIAAAAQGPYAPGAQEGILERALALLTATWICTLAVILFTTSPVSDQYRPAMIDNPPGFD
jgi:Protein of unknown function (DUF998)